MSRIFGQIQDKSLLTLMRQVLHSGCVQDVQLHVWGRERH